MQSIPYIGQKQASKAWYGEHHFPFSFLLWSYVNYEHIEDEKLNLFGVDQRCILNSLEDLRWSLFVKIINSFYPLTIIVELLS